jgi:hypothetical protein
MGMKKEKRKEPGAGEYVEEISEGLAETQKLFNDQFSEGTADRLAEKKKRGGK